MTSSTTRLDAALLPQYQEIGSSDPSGRTIGGKAEGLIKLREILTRLPSTPLPVKVPHFIPLSHEEIIEFLRGSSTEGLVELLEEEYRLLLEDVENRALDSGRERVARLKVILTEHLKDFPVRGLSVGSVYMVRSSSCEDSKSNPNAGGNESIAHVSPREIGVAIAETISSYFSPKSLLQRSIDGEKLSRELPPLSVLIQEMIGEDEEAIPVSGVIFTEYMVRGTILIQSSFGHGNGVVTADGSIGIDSYFCDEDGGVYAKCAHKPVRQLADPTHKFIRKENTQQMSSSLSLSPEMIQTLRMVALQAREIEGQELDLEFTCKNGVVFLLQMRPLTLEEPKANYIRDEYLRPIGDVEVLAAPHMKVIQVESSASVIRERTLALALNHILSLPKEERERHSVVFSEEGAASTSHEATTFRMLGITAVRTSHRRGLPESFLVDVQRSIIAEPIDPEGIVEGYTAYPDRGPFTLELLSDIEPRLCSRESLRFLDGRDLSEHLQEALRTGDESYGYLVAIHLGFLIERIKKYYPERIEDLPILVGLHRQLCKAVSRDFHIGSRLLAKSATIKLAERLKSIESHMKKYEPKAEEQSVESRKRYICENRIRESFFDKEIERCFDEMLAGSSGEELEELFRIGEIFEQRGIFSQWVFSIIGSFLREGNRSLVDLIALSRIPESSSLVGIEYLQETASQETIIERLERLSRIHAEEYEPHPLAKIIYGKLLKNGVEIWDLHIKQLKTRFPLDEKLHETIKHLLEAGYQLSLQLINSSHRVETIMRSGYVRILETQKNQLFSTEFSEELYIPSREFDVRGAIYLAATYLERHLPQTLEDMFTLIHQNIISLSNCIEFSNEASLIPSQYKVIYEMLNPFKTAAQSAYAREWLLKRARLISIGECNGNFQMEFQIPQRNHSSKLLVREEKGIVTIQLDFLTDSNRSRSTTIELGLPLLFRMYGFSGGTTISPCGHVIECKAHLPKNALRDEKPVILMTLYNFILYIGMRDMVWGSEERFLEYCRRNDEKIFPIGHTVDKEELPETLARYHSLIQREFQKSTLDTIIVPLKLCCSSRRISEKTIEYSSVVFENPLSIFLEEINDDEVLLIFDLRKITNLFPMTERHFFTLIKPILDRESSIAIQADPREGSPCITFRLREGTLSVQKAVHIVELFISLFQKTTEINEKIDHKSYGNAIVFFQNKQEIEKVGLFLEIKRDLNLKLHREEESDLDHSILQAPHLLFLLEPSSDRGYSRCIQLIEKIPDLHIRMLAIIYLLERVIQLDISERRRILDQINDDCIADLLDFTAAGVGISSFADEKMEDFIDQIMDRSDVANKFFTLFRNLFNPGLSQDQALSAIRFLKKLHFNTPKPIAQAFRRVGNSKIIGKCINPEIFLGWGAISARKKHKWESPQGRELVEEYFPFFYENLLKSMYGLEYATFFKEFLANTSFERKLRWFESYIREESDNSDFFSIFTVDSIEELEQCFDSIRRVGETNPYLYQGVRKFLISPAVIRFGSKELFESNREIIRNIFLLKFYIDDLFEKAWRERPDLIEVSLRIILSEKEGPILPIEWWDDTGQTTEEIIELFSHPETALSKKSKEEEKRILEEICIRRTSFKERFSIQSIERIIRSPRVLEAILWRYPKVFARSITESLLLELLQSEIFTTNFISCLDRIPYEEPVIRARISPPEEMREDRSWWFEEKEDIENQYSKLFIELDQTPPRLSRSAMNAIGERFFMLEIEIRDKIKGRIIEAFLQSISPELKARMMDLWRNREFRNECISSIQTVSHREMFIRISISPFEEMGEDRSWWFEEKDDIENQYSKLFIELDQTPPRLSRSAMNAIEENLLIFIEGMKDPFSIQGKIIEAFIRSLSPESKARIRASLAHIDSEEIEAFKRKIS